MFTFHPSAAATHVVLFVVVLCIFAGTIETTTTTSAVENGAAYTIQVYTVATEPTDGFLRFNRSARVHGIAVRTLGFGQPWLGGDMQSTGGGYKLHLLRDALDGLEHDDETLVLFTDGYDVVYTQSLDVIVQRFRLSGAGVLFGAEHMLWPDQSLEPRYPMVSDGARFLNSGMFIGRAARVCALLDRAGLAQTDDDQLFFTRAYLDVQLREKLLLRLDHRSEIFQNLNGAVADVNLKFSDEGRAQLINTAYNTEPAVVHGNGPSKYHLNNYGNYLAGAFAGGVCHACNELRRTFADDDADLPTVTVAVFVERATPFFDDFLELCAQLDYPKAKLHLFVHNAVANYSEQMDTWLAEVRREYASVKYAAATVRLDEAEARTLAVGHAERVARTDYLFVVDSDARLDNARTLRELVAQNRSLVAPLLRRHKEVWSNFWGALGENGFYARSHDYMAIVEEEIRGTWNVPHVGSCYLAKRAILSSMSYDDVVLEPDMALTKALRKHDIHMHVANDLAYGHLVNEETYNPMQTRPDFYTMLTNTRDWERHYLHPEYAAQLAPGAQLRQPCPDVYWFAIVTERFCADLVAIMEAFGKWSSGTEKDERLATGYEAVPTRDIHMSQVDLEPMWLKFLQIYVRPLQEAVYLGYFHNPPKALMNFVVRYKPTEQPFLKPHHDSSTYTINIALNRAGVDYVGGGCRFLRYNCSVTDTKVGHMLMHPGRLTHYHEGLYVTEGTRYIMISFVDP